MEAVICLHFSIRRVGLGVTYYTDWDTIAMVDTTAGILCPNGLALIESKETQHGAISTGKVL